MKSRNFHATRSSSSPRRSEKQPGRSGKSKPLCRNQVLLDVSNVTLTGLLLILVMVAVRFCRHKQCLFVFFFVPNTCRFLLSCAKLDTPPAEPVERASSSNSKKGSEKFSERRPMPQKSSSNVSIMTWMFNICFAFNAIKKRIIRS